MNQGLRRGVRTVSWTRVLPPRARQGPIHRGWQARGIQIRAAASEQPATVNGENIPITSTPNSAESRGMLHDSGFPEAVSLLHGRSCMLTRSKKNRCAVRCYRRSILVTISFALRFAESLYSTRDIGWIEWEGRQCMRLPGVFFVKIDQLTTDISAQVVSTLSVLEPVRRAPVGIPFLYQKVRPGNFIYFG